MPLAGSAMMVAAVAEEGILLIAAPPSFTKSCSLSSRALPTPSTISRARSRPDGATISSADPLLPLKLSAAAARARRSPEAATALRAAEPYLRPSSQSTMRTPFGVAASGANSSFKAVGIGGPLLRELSQSERWSAAGFKRRMKIRPQRLHPSSQLIDFHEQSPNSSRLGIPQRLGGGSRYAPGRLTMQRPRAARRSLGLARGPRR